MIILWPFQPNRLTFSPTFILKMQKNSNLTFKTTLLPTILNAEPHLTQQMLSGN